MNFILIALCLIAGLLVRLSGKLPEDSHRGINAWLLYIAMPAMALLYVPSIKWSAALILPALMPFLIWGGAWITSQLAQRWFSLDDGTRTALLLTAGLGNTSFLGFPLTQAYLGEEGLRIAVICDQVSFIVLSTLGVMSAVKGAHGAGAGAGAVAGSILRFPAFLAFIAAIALPPFIDLSPLNPLLSKLAGTLVPLALFSVGFQLRLTGWRGELRPLAAGLTYKLLIGPGLILAVALSFQIRGTIAQASIFEAAMPPMITSAILASEYRLNPGLSNLMVSVGIVLSMVTTGLWYLALRLIGV